MKETQKLYNEILDSKLSGLETKISLKIENLHDKVDSMHEMTNQILEQTKKTNGRVTALESFKVWMVGVSVGVVGVVSVVWSFIKYLK